METVKHIWLVTCLALIGLGLATLHLVQPGHPPNWPGALIGIGMILLVVPPVLMWGWRFGGVIGDNIEAASLPIPEPFEIQQLLEMEWDRPVTMTEALQVHQYLISNRNQAVLAAGVGLGALYLMNRSV